LREAPGPARRTYRRPGCREFHEEGRANRSQKAARFPSLGRSDPWPARVVARGPFDACKCIGHANAAGITAGEQRSESPARARGSDARRVCPRVVYGCRSRQAMSRAQRSASRWQRDAWTGARPTRTQKGSPGSNDIDSRRRGGKAAAPGRPEPGARESVAGRRSLPDGRHSGSSFRSASIHASAAGGGLGPSQEGRQECQRLGRLLAQALRRSESLCREAGESPGTQAEACAARNQRGAGARTKT